MSENNTTTNQPSLFELAARQKLRFPSSRGELTVENLWEKDLPLQSKNGYDLDSIAKGVNAKIKALSEDSFVSTKPNPALAKQQLMLDVLKHVIAVRLAEQAAREKRASNKAERERLTALLESKQQAADANLTTDQILAKLANLRQEEDDAE